MTLHAVRRILFTPHQMVSHGSLGLLPTDVLPAVADWLAAEELGALCATCRRMRDPRPPSTPILSPYKSLQKPNHHAIWIVEPRRHHLPRGWELFVFCEQSIFFCSCTQLGEGGGLLFGCKTAPRINNECISRDTLRRGDASGVAGGRGAHPGFSCIWCYMVDNQSGTLWMCIHLRAHNAETQAFIILRSLPCSPLCFSKWTVDQDSFVLASEPA